MFLKITLTVQRPDSSILSYHSIFKPLCIQICVEVSDMHTYAPTNTSYRQGFFKHMRQKNQFTNLQSAPKALICVSEADFVGKGQRSGEGLFWSVFVWFYVCVCVCV